MTLLLFILIKMGIECNIFVQKMGFIKEGRKIKEFKMDENEYVDDILMYKLV